MRKRGLINAMWEVIRAPDFYEMVLRIYLPILFPITYLLILLGLHLDVWLGVGPLLPDPWQWVAGSTSFLLGSGLWLLTYHELIFGGEGSPSPAIKHTQKLVTWGIYAYCRNPSVHGKLLGVLGVGFVVNSPSFCLGVVPLLLAGSLYEKVWRQEPVLVELFGEEYLEYRRRVPLFIPRLWVTAQERRRPKQEQVAPPDPGSSPSVQEPSGQEALTLAAVPDVPTRA